MPASVAVDSGEPMKGDRVVKWGQFVSGCYPRVERKDQNGVIKTFLPKTGDFTSISMPPQAPGDSSYTQVSCDLGGTPEHPVIAVLRSNSTPGSGLNSERPHCDLAVISIPDGKVVAQRDIYSESGKQCQMTLYASPSTVLVAGAGGDGESTYDRVLSLADLHPLWDTRGRDGHFEHPYDDGYMSDTAPMSRISGGSDGLVDLRTGKVIAQGTYEFTPLRGTTYFQHHCENGTNCGTADIIDPAGKVLATVPSLGSMTVGEKMLAVWGARSPAGGGTQIPEFATYDLTTGKILVDLKGDDAANLNINGLSIYGYDLYLTEESAASGKQRVVVDGKTGKTDDARTPFSMIPLAALNGGWTVNFDVDKPNGYWDCAVPSIQLGCYLELTHG
ncbi:hypothetical protein MYK68_08645 [Gordonia sp. PP30]|uniref:hypothetical protein n=1 Tax=unclassified Gordonia (in: high G+C Gram-positive bacteria) TaxID=2657482 RepID=UPI001FFF7A7B|nr:hypothetical protein [Gordonia sp. PP30]UQE76609.1 hypothetical protein MYK68_08645 [Gordonia sp. PP30]